MSRIILWNEPMWFKPDVEGENNIAGNIICSATEEDVINWQKCIFPERNYSDDMALADFLVVNWAWYKDGV